MKEPKGSRSQDDEPVTSGESLKVFITSIALFLILFASAWEAIGENYAVALSDISIGIYLISIVFEKRFSGVTAPLIGAALFIFRDLAVRLSSGIPPGIDWNLLGAGFCFWEAARTLYGQGNDDSTAGPEK